VVTPSTPDHISACCKIDSAKIVCHSHNVHILLDVGMHTCMHAWHSCRITVHEHTWMHPCMHTHKYCWLPCRLRYGNIMLNALSAWYFQPHWCAQSFSCGWLLPTLSSSHQHSHTKDTFVGHPQIDPCHWSAILTHNSPQMSADQSP